MEPAWDDEDWVRAYGAGYKFIEAHRNDPLPTAEESRQHMAAVERELGEAQDTDCAKREERGIAPGLRWHEEKRLSELQHRHWGRYEDEALSLEEKAEMDLLQAKAEMAVLDDTLARYPKSLSASKEEQADSLVSLLSIDSWIERDIPEPDRLLGDLLTTTSRMFLVGRTGLGKTMFALAIAVGVASGSGFLRWPAGRPARVIYLDGEMPAELIKPRARDAVRRLKDAHIPPGNLLIFGRDIEADARRTYRDLPPFAPLNTEAGRTFLMALIDAVGDVDLIIFDNVMSLVSGDQKDEVPWSETLPLIASLTDQRIGQLWLDHTGHNSDRQYGSSTKAWRFDAVGIMKPVEGESDPRSAAFTLSFDHPGKARRRTPDNWQQFVAQIIRLVDDGWACDPVTNVAAKAEHAVRPAAASRYDALLAVLSHAGAPATTKTDWYAECVKRGLDDAVPEGASGVARAKIMAQFRTRVSELVAAGWVQVNGEAVMDLKSSDKATPWPEFEPGV